MTTEWHSPDQPPMRLQELLGRWLAPLRTRLLKHARVHKRTAIVDLGCGAGVVTRELVQRSEAKVWAVDKDGTILKAPEGRYGGAERLVVNAANLPFPEQSVDLVFTQFSLMWMPLHETLEEIWRVLTPGGMLVAIEPDYAGLIEYPPEVAVKDIWVSALTRAKGHIDAGRRLPGLLTRRGFDVRVDLAGTIRTAAAQRFELLAELNLEDAETRRMHSARRMAESLRGPWEQVVHLPVFGVTASKPSLE